jgi:hypothetical protein
VKVPGRTKSNNDFSDIKQLIQVMQKDPVVHERVLHMLRLDSYNRRMLLNNWLEQLRTHNASEHLLSALACLFDDKIAAKFLALIDNDKDWTDY